MPAGWLKERKGVDYFCSSGTGLRFAWAQPKNKRLDLRVTESFHSFFKQFCKDNNLSPGDFVMNSTILLIYYLQKPNFLTLEQRAELSELIEAFIVK